MSDNKLSASESGKLGGVRSAENSRIRKQERIDLWDKNPKLCKFCKTPLSYDKRMNDFCSQSCGAKFNNESRGFDLAENKLHICNFCFKPFKAKGTEERKYCSRECMSAFWWNETKQNLINLQNDTSYNHLTAKKYLIEINSGKCQICGLDKWMGQSIPLVLDHIDGNSDNGNLSNLRVICNNCDALTETYKGKNKGKGRSKRRQRYKEGKSY